MSNLRRAQPPRIKDEDDFNEDYRDLRENVVLKVDQDTVSSADADATYGTAERDLINELKTVVNALIAQLE